MDGRIAPIYIVDLAFTHWPDLGFQLSCEGGSEVAPGSLKKCIREMGLKYSKLDWAKSLRKIPKSLIRQIEEMEDGYFVAACTKELFAEDFESERYAHLNILDESDLVEDWTSLIPTPNVGRTSYLNCEVSEEIDKKAGKVSKRFVSQAPNWKGSGMHEIRFSKDVWAKKLIPPVFSQIGFRRLESGEERKRLLVHFEVHELFHPQLENVEKKLLRALNLLQENVGKVGLSEVNETDRTRIGALSHSIGWIEVKNADAKTILSSLSLKEVEHRLQAEKLSALLELSPLRIARGTGGFSAYLAIQYSQDFFVLGNFSTGKLLYAVKADWKKMSQWSKDDLGAAMSGAVERIVHKPDWYDKLRTRVLKERGEPLDDQTLLNF